MKIQLLATSLLVSVIVAMSSVARCGESPVVTSDWPQWRGPNRDSISPETGLALDWNTQPPREMWTAEVGNGLSCVLAVKNRAFTTGWTSNHGGETSVWCFNAETGTVLWKYTYPDVRFLSGDHGLPDPKTLVGPNATPCVDGDRIYTSTSSGQACCLRTDTGEVIWERDLRADTGADRNDRCSGHGESDINVASPLVIGDVVIFGVGSTGVGVDKLTGKIRWGWTGGGQTVASPIRIPVDGVDYVGVVDSEKGIHIVQVANGKELRKIGYPPARYAPDPLLFDGKLILNSECYSIKSGQTIWKTKGGAYAPNLVHKGYLYQCDQYEGHLYCIDIKDGSVKCSGDIPKYNSVIMAQGKLLAQGDEIHVVQASPEGIKVEGKIKLPGKYQGYLALPSISDGRLFVRSQVGKVIAYDIRAPGHPRYAANRAVVSATTSAVSASPVVVKPTDQDWPQWRGPQRNGIAPANNLKLDWISGTPKPLWQANVGPAFSGLVMAGDRIYTIGFSYRNNFYYGGAGTPWVTVDCIDARNGQTVWEQSYGGFPRSPGYVTPDLSVKVYGNFPFWNYNLFYFGAYATLALDGDRLYVLNQAGIAMCLSATDGSVVWQKNLTKDLELDRPNWFFNGSPLVLDKAVVLAIGTAGVALDKMNGKVIWSTGKESSGCASPVLFTQGGQQRLAMFGKNKLYTLAADTGTTLWNYNWVDGYNRNMSDPVPFGNDQLLVSGAKGKGSALLKVGTDRPVWEQKALDPIMGTPVLYQGYLYGPSQSKKGVVCLDAKTGAVQWTSEPMPATQVIVSGETLVIQCQNGEIHLAKASPQGYQSLGKCHPLQSENCFTPPVIAHGKLLCRSWEGDIVALDLSALEPVRALVITPLPAERMMKLVAQLGAPTKVQRQTAIDGLAQAHDEELPHLLPALITAFKTSSWFSQDAAGEVLQQLGTKAKPVAADLVALANASITKHDWAMVVVLLDALKKVDPTSLVSVSPAIQATMNDTEREVRIAAMQFLDRVPLTDGLVDALLTQAKIKDNYFYMGTVVRRIGLLGPAVGEKLLPKILPSLEHPGKPGMLEWQTALFMLRDLGPSARNALSVLMAFSTIDTWKTWDVGLAKTFSDETLRCVKLLENSNHDPLCRYTYLNTPPTVKDMQLTCAKGKTVTAKMDCHDSDDFERNLEITVITQPAHGKVNVTNLTMEYQPDNTYVGNDSFTWKAADPTDESGTATVTIQVTAGNALNAK